MAKAGALVTNSMRTFCQNPHWCIRVITPDALLENVVSFSRVVPPSPAHDCGLQEIWYRQSVGELRALRGNRVCVFRERHPVSFRPAVAAIPFGRTIRYYRELYGHPRFRKPAFSFGVAAVVRPEHQG